MSSRVKSSREIKEVVDAQKSLGKVEVLFSTWYVLSTPMNNLISWTPCLLEFLNKTTLTPIILRVTDVYMSAQVIKLMHKLDCVHPTAIWRRQWKGLVCGTIHAFYL